MAHAGHVVLDSLVYGGPVVVLAASVFAFAKFERRLVPDRHDEIDEDET